MRNAGRAIWVAAVAVLVAAFPAVGHAGAERSRAQASPSLAAHTRTVRVAGGRLGYRAFGRGSPMVLIQGYGVTIDEWDPRFLDELARTHRVVVYDNRGVGRSAGSTERLTIATMADDGAALIRALRLRRPIVLGHSMGGMIAQELTLRHPRSLSRLILTSTGPGGAGEVPPMVEMVSRLAPPYDDRTVLDLLFSTPAAARAYTRSCDRRGRLEEVPVPVQQAQANALGNWLAGEGSWDRLPTLRVPTLVAVGTDDQLAPPENGDRMSQRIPGARLLRFAGGRHDFYMEQSTRFVRAVNRFLASA